MQTKKSPPWVTLESDRLQAEVNPLGAQLSVLKYRGLDLLWDGDPSFWTGRSPILFPIVGALAGGRYRLGSHTYELPRHGFARGRIFELAASTPDSAAFRLQADATTLAAYPFHFELEVGFTLAGTMLTVTARVRNRGGVDMPASFGYHPALRWPLPFGCPRSSHAIEFQREEPAPIRRLDAAGLLSAARHPTPVEQRRLALKDELFADDVIIFDEIRSRSVTYGADGAPRIQVSYPDAPYLGLWTKPGAHFICIEPWHGVADPAGFTGDFTAKPGVFSVAPGAEMSITLSLTVIDP
jgi:galactose mutarotase-like enzyme